jgi:hypothetical protein
MIPTKNVSKQGFDSEPIKITKHDENMKDMQGGFGKR